MHPLWPVTQMYLKSPANTISQCRNLTVLFVHSLDCSSSFLMFFLPFAQDTYECTQKKNKQKFLFVKCCLSNLARNSSSCHKNYYSSILGIFFTFHSLTDFCSQSIIVQWEKTTFLKPSIVIHLAGALRKPLLARKSNSNLVVFNSCSTQM